MKIKRTLLGACAAALLVPAAAQAATVTQDGDTIVYSGAAGGAMNLSVYTFEDWNTGNRFLHFTQPATIQTGMCEDSVIGGVDCDLGAHRPLRIEGSAAKDWIHLSQGIDAIPDSMPVTINGNGGNDKLEDVFNSTAGRTFNGGPGSDEIWGYEGNDTVDGGDGDDDLDGGEGNDRVLGGAGSDKVDGDGYKEAGSDVIDGGPGYDYADGWHIPEDLSHQPAFDITLDGVANDGRPGERDNVTNVEDFEMYTVGRFVGTDAPEKVVVYNPANDGPSTLIGNGGDDELIGNDFNDTVDGGVGNDHVEGGLGNDTVTGGPGQDTIYGDATSSYCSWYSCKVPFGNDTINARDGEVDNVDCGLGTDRAIVDAIDVVANCESVDAAGTGPGSGAGAGGNGATGGGGGNGSGGGSGGGSAVTFSLGSAKLRSVAAKGLKVKVACAAACTVKGSATADKATARTLRARTVARGSAKRSKAGTATLTLKVSRAVARRLKTMRAARVTVKVTVKPKGGAARNGSRALTLKR